MRPIIAFMLVGCLLAASVAARGGHSAGSSHRTYGSSHPRAATSHVSGPASHRASSTRPASHGRIHRSRAVRDAFEREHPCPATGKRSGACPGYVVDHVKPLACGGADDPSNMTWQTAADGKAKDKWERNGCGGGGHR